MKPPQPLPATLTNAFSTRQALQLGVPPERLRARDLARPFQGVRTRVVSPLPEPDHPYERARIRELELVLAVATRLLEGQFITHRSAALLYGAPLPHLQNAEPHIGVLRPRRSARVRGAIGHSFHPARVQTVVRDGVRLTDPASTFAMLGTLDLPDLVALGDYLVRVHRPGHGRPNAGKPPLTTIAELREVVSLGRWRGIGRLRQAVDLIREDSWSPKESATRLSLVLAGLPEPELNVDIFDRDGRFLGCSDLVFRQHKVLVDYQGDQHKHTYAADVERYEALKAAGWRVILVTRALAGRDQVVVHRVTDALWQRGWRPGPSSPAFALK